MGEVEIIGKIDKAIILAISPLRERTDIIYTQNFFLKNYCRNNGFTILEIFAFFKNPDFIDATEFKKVTKLIYNQKETIAVIIHNVKDIMGYAYILNYLVQKGKIELHVYTQKYLISKNSNPEDCWNTLVAIDESFISKLWCYFNL